MSGDEVVNLGLICYERAVCLFCWFVDENG